MGTNREQGSREARRAQTHGGQPCASTAARQPTDRVACGLWSACGIPSVSESRIAILAGPDAEPYPAELHFTTTFHGAIDPQGSRCAPTSPLPTTHAQVAWGLHFTTTFHGAIDPRPRCAPKATRTVPSPPIQEKNYLEEMTVAGWAFVGMWWAWRGIS